MKNIFAIIVFIILALFLSCNEEQPAYPPVLGDGVAEVISSEIVLKSSFNTSDFETVSECGFVIGRDTIFNEYTKVMSKKVSNNFSCTLENIDSGKYYAKSYARNRIGTGYGKLFSFEVLHNLPTVQTFDATNIGTSNATLNGYVWSVGDNSITMCGFVYGTNASSLTQNVQSGSGTGSYNKSITGLAAGTTYYFKAYATNSAGTAYGDLKQFSTTSASQKPTVVTNNATNITSTSATLNGNVTTNGGATVTSRGFVYGTSSSNLSHNVQSGSGTGSYNKSITGLAAGTTYYFKAYATNSAGTAYGSLKQFTIIVTTGTLNGHDWVDLGLPSGTKWATCNVGASTSTAYGDYFAWGETTTKTTYNWSTYRYCNGSSRTLTKYCNNSNYGNSGFTDALTTLEASDDAATANWGSAWRMPTTEEFDELKNNCTVTWTTQNGINGRMFTGPNGNTIFLPAGYYWSSSLYSDYPSYAWYLSIGSSYCDMYGGGRDYRRRVRPVCNPN